MYRLVETKKKHCKSAYQSVSPRLVASYSFHGRHNKPRPSGDHGIADTPKYCNITQNACLNEDGGKEATNYLQCRNHFSLFLSVDETVMVLHRDERCEIVGDSVVCVYPEGIFVSVCSETVGGTLR